jgi:hypothetical protein
MAQRGKPNPHGSGDLVAKPLKCRKSKVDAQVLVFTILGSNSPEMLTENLPQYKKSSFIYVKLALRQALTQL